MLAGDVSPLQAAKALEESAPDNAIASYNEILNAVSSDLGDDVLRDKETALLSLSSLYAKLRKGEAIAELLISSRPFLAIVPKAKAAKIVRVLVDDLATIPNVKELQLKVVKEAIEWSELEKRIFLRQSLESRLAGLYYDNKRYSEALAMIATLLKELKRLDDKMMLVDVHLLESRVYHSLRNLPKARAALTSARTAANAIYCPPLLQGSLDMQSGVLHAEEKDYKTAYSYFYETFEGFSSQEDPRAILALKYLLLSKIMLNLPDDVQAIVHGKHGLRYAGSQVDAMKSIANALKKRSLLDFERSLSTYQEELKNDPIISSHLSSLYDTLLEENLKRIIEPFSKVEVEHLAKLIQLPSKTVECKLSQMILDKKLNGIIDQGSGCLIVFVDTVEDKGASAVLSTLRSMGQVVESLYQKAGRL